MQQAYMEHQRHTAWPPTSALRTGHGRSAGTQDKTGGMASYSRKRQAGFHPAWKPHVVGNYWQVGAEGGCDEPQGVRIYWRNCCVSPRSWDLIPTWRKHGLHCLPPKTLILGHARGRTYSLWVSSKSRQGNQSVAFLWFLKLCFMAHGGSGRSVVDSKCEV